MVVIKDFEMPKECLLCNFCDSYNKCIVNDEWVDDAIEDDNRSADCPLVEIKENEDATN